MWSTLVIVSYCCRKPTTIYLFACALRFGQGEPGTRNSIVKINQTDFTLVTVFVIVTVIVFSLVLARLFRCSDVFTSCSSSPNIYSSPHLVAERMEELNVQPSFEESDC